MGNYGLGVGLLVGLTGVGGGSLMTPLLILLFGIHPATAVGTDLLYACATKSAGTAMHGLGCTVEWRVARRLTLGSLPATVATMLVLDRAGPPDLAAGHVISGVLGAALLLTAAALLFRPQIAAFAARPPPGGRPCSPWSRAACWACSSPCPRWTPAPWA